MARRKAKKIATYMRFNNEEEIIGNLQSKIADLEEQLATAVREALDPTKSAHEKSKTFAWQPVNTEATGIAQTLSERGNRYGDFGDNARISQDLKRVLETQLGWGTLSCLHREGITMILQKLARIVNGDPNYKDNWHDIQGYAKLVEDRLP